MLCMLTTRVEGLFDTRGFFGLEKFILESEARSTILRRELTGVMWFESAVDVILEVGILRVE